MHFHKLCLLSHYEDFFQSTLVRVLNIFGTFACMMRAVCADGLSHFHINFYSVFIVSLRAFSFLMECDLISPHDGTVSKSLIQLKSVTY